MSAFDLEKKVKETLSQYINERAKMYYNTLSDEVIDPNIDGQITLLTKLLYDIPSSSVALNVLYERARKLGIDVSYNVAVIKVVEKLVNVEEKAAAERVRGKGIKIIKPAAKVAPAEAPEPAPAPASKAIKGVLKPKVPLVVKVPVAAKAPPIVEEPKAPAKKLILRGIVSYKPRSDVLGTSSVLIGISYSGTVTDNEIVDIVIASIWLSRKYNIKLLPNMGSIQSAMADLSKLEIPADHIKMANKIKSYKPTDVAATQVWINTIFEELQNK